MDSNRRINQIFKGLGLFLWILTFIWLHNYFGLRESFLDTLFLIGIPILVYLGIGFFLPRLILSRGRGLQEEEEPEED
jgi:hypothetical protein